MLSDNCPFTLLTFPVLFCAHHEYLKCLTWILLMNKVCASGMKAVMLASQQVQLGHPGVLVAVRIKG